MGSVRVSVYNQQLMESYSYTKLNHIKALLRNMSNLEKMCAKGDTVAGAIMIDLKTCLGDYGLHQTTLDEREIEVIKSNLIDGIPQGEIAEDLGVGQNWVSVIMNTGIKKIQKQLVHGKGADNEREEINDR